ncbi:MAG: hypothetical protein HY927_14605 [Elusimicrobia bacterium]|nr:hypothetical protein [Elusimicrobiota bacterium]
MRLFLAAALCLAARPALFAADPPSPSPQDGAQPPVKISSASPPALKRPGAARACRPRLDVRRLLSVTFDGRRVASLDDLARLPSEGQRSAAAIALSELCDPDGSTLQEMAKFLRAPVTVELAAECADVSYYNPSSRSVRLSSFPPCSNDMRGTLYHELMHAVFADHAESGQSVWDTITLCFSQAHDESIMDPDDRTFLNVMDARTTLGRALDEGVADGVSLAFEPSVNRGIGYMRQFRLETQSATWRRMEWPRKQANEWLVAAVIFDYLGKDRTQAAERLGRLVSVLNGARPETLQDLLQGLEDNDPVVDRPRIDRILDGLQAGWSGEREEILRLRR